MWSNHWLKVFSSNSFSFNNPWIIIRLRDKLNRVLPERQRKKTPIRYTLFSGFLDDKLRYGGSHFLPFNYKYAFILKEVLLFLNIWFCVKGLH